MLKARGIIGLLLVTLALGGVLAACGQEEPTATPVPTATPTVASAATATPTATPSAEELFQAKWDQLKADAQAEGDLVIVLGSSGSRTDRRIFEAFGQKFGVTVIQTTGSGSTNADRVLAERARGIYTVDVSFVGSSSTDRLRLAGALQEIQPYIFHPDVVDRSKGWLLKDWAWTDVENKYSPAYNLRLRENILEIYYNTDKVSQAEIDGVQSWQDFLKPEWKGRIVSILDPDFGGVITDRTLAWILLGQEWLEPYIRNQEPTLLSGGNFAEMSKGIGRGKYDLAFFTGAAGTDMEQMQTLGLPVKKLTRTLSEGGTVEVRGTMVIFDRAPHINAAQLFVNWFLSRDGQQTRHDLVDDIDPSPSLRTDLTQGNVTDRTWSLLKSIDPASAMSQSTPEYFAARDEVIAWTRVLFAELGHYGY